MSLRICVYTSRLNDDITLYMCVVQWVFNGHSECAYKTTNTIQ